MSTAIRSPGGVFVRSAGGVRETEEGAPPILITSFESLGQASTYQSFNTSDLPVPYCAGGTFTILGSWAEMRVPATGASKNWNVTGITQANPAVVTTSSAHFFTNLMNVEIKNIGGMPELGTGPFRIVVVTANTFQLIDVDSIGYSPYTGGGTTNTIPVPELWRYQRQGLTSGYLENISHKCAGSPGYDVYDLDDNQLSNQGLFGTQGLESYYGGFVDLNLEGFPWVQNELVIVRSIVEVPALTGPPNESHSQALQYQANILTSDNTGPVEAAGWVLSAPSVFDFIIIDNGLGIQIRGNFDPPDIGQVIPFSVTGTNARGSDVHNWNVTVTV